MTAHPKPRAKKRGRQHVENNHGNALVRIIRNDDGDLEPGWRDWHLVDPGNPQGPATLCTAEFFGSGESACEFQNKYCKRGGITCGKCLQILRAYKAVRL